MKRESDVKDKYRGCLIGGAAGDALGYAVEFDDIGEILDIYGERGITEYSTVDGVAQISDDTQMTLFTGAGLLQSGSTESAVCVDSIWSAYKEWLITQEEVYPAAGSDDGTGLLAVPELFAWRAPGGTCLSALSGKKGGTLTSPVNDSKGCGGVMRVAPVGLYFDSFADGGEAAGMVAAEAAALTHGHPLGWLPAAALAHMVARIVHEEYSIEEAVCDMKLAMGRQFGHLAATETMLGLVDKAVKLAGKNINDIKAIARLGEGWVAEETLAIAIYCAVKYQDDFGAAVAASVNHSGDSDSTGAVTGNLVGAYLGMSGIPEKFLNGLELKEVIVKMADDLYNK